MVWHLITYAMVLPWLPMCMIMILEVQKIENLYVPKCNEELCKRSFAYQGSTLWNDLPDEVKESGSLEGFKFNYRFYVG